MVKKKKTKKKTIHLIILNLFTLFTAYLSPAFIHFPYIIEKHFMKFLKVKVLKNLEKLI